MSTAPSSADSFPPLPASEFLRLKARARTTLDAAALGGLGPQRWTMAERESDLVCFSHLHWDFVIQRPQHLLTRFSIVTRVFYVEEPVADAQAECLEIAHRAHGLRVVTPHLPAGLPEDERNGRLARLIDHLFREQRIVRPTLWFYTPMALPFTRHLEAEMVVYDCMDELSCFAGAAPSMRAREQELLAWADVVFTGGQSLYEEKRQLHPRVHAFPSSIDRQHFAQARAAKRDPPDQAAIPHPRIGFFGVIDERFDCELLRGIAAARPEWSFVIIGPVVKIDAAALPRSGNIHYLGRKDYHDLPGYLGGWDVAMLPFARNDATRFISPTKTPEYLSAGCPVVSTPITDVVRPYGEQRLVRIAATPEEFVQAITDCTADRGDPAWWRRVDDFLKNVSWDQTWSGMVACMRAVHHGRSHATGDGRP